MDKNKLDEFYQGIEILKDGWAYDTRYKYKKIKFTRPHIWIACNVIPDLSLLTLDKWKFWTIHEGKLIEYNNNINEINHLEKELARLQEELARVREKRARLQEK